VEDLVLILVSEGSNQQSTQQFEGFAKYVWLLS